MVRRYRTARPENELKLALAEIERLKAITTRITDGREIVLIPGDDPGAGEIPPMAVADHVLYGSKHTRSFRVTAAEGVSLVISYEQGQIWIGGSFFSIVAGTLLMTDATTNYVFVNNAGAVASNTTSFPSDSVPLATVVTAAGDITSVNDRRSYLVQGGFGGGVVLGNPLLVGTDDTAPGTIILYGDGAGSDLGGAMRLHLAADHDATFEHWGIDAYQNDLRFSTSDAAIVNMMTAEGSLQLPGQGSFAGIRMGGDVPFYRSNPGEMYINANVVLPDLRRLVIGNDVGVSFGGDVSLSFLGTGAADTRMGFGRWSNDAAGPQMVFLKSRDPAIGSQTIVQDGDDAGSLAWSVDDGVFNSSVVAKLSAKVEGVPAVGDTPGELVFFTTSVGSITASEKMSLSPAGQLRINTAGAAGGILLGPDVSLFRAASLQLGITARVLIDGALTNASVPVLNVAATQNPVGRSMIESHIDSDGANTLLFRVLDQGHVLIGGDLDHNGASIGFFGVAPVARASAYTQTFATADKTHAADGSADMPAGGGGTAAGGWDTAANRDQAIAEFAALRVTVDDLKRLVNAVIDDLQAYGLLQ